jgi:hypothetical protein
LTYDAFISYSHNDDARIAKAVHEGLLAIAKPWDALKMLSVFRDETGLRVGDVLDQTLSDALDASRFLIVIASPGAADSPWVRRELERFLSNHSSKQILIVQVRGDLAWDTERHAFHDSATSAFPRLGTQTFEAEPLYLDLRWTSEERAPSLANPRFFDAMVSLAAALRDLPRKDVEGGYLRAQLRARRLERFNIALRAVLGFGGSAGLLLLLPWWEGPLSGCSLTGCLGALSVGLGLRGVIAFGIAFAALLPVCAAGNFLPFAGFGAETFFLALLYVLGFLLAGTAGTAFSRRTDWKDGALAFGVGGLAAAGVWLGFPQWRAIRMDTYFFGPWQYERINVAMYAARYSLLATINFVPFLVGAATGGLLLGLRAADRSVRLPLQRRASIIASIATRAMRHIWLWRLGLVITLAGIALWIFSLTTQFQILAVIHAMHAYQPGEDGYPFSRLSVPLILRARRDLIRRGLVRQAGTFSELLTRYAGADGLKDTTPMFAKFEAWQDLKDFLVVAEAEVGKISINDVEPTQPQKSQKQTERDQLWSLFQQADVHAALDATSSFQKLISIAEGWAIYGDEQRFKLAVTRAANMTRLFGEQRLSASEVTRVVATLIKSGKSASAKAILDTVGLAPEHFGTAGPGIVDGHLAVHVDVDRADALIMSSAGLWPPGTPKPNWLKVVELLGEGHGVQALTLVKTLGALDYKQDDFRPGILAAVETGSAALAFAMLDFAAPLETDKDAARVAYLRDMTLAAKEVHDGATLNLIRLNLQELQTRIQSDTSPKAFELRRRLMEALIRTGDLPTDVRVVEAGGVDSLIALAEAYLVVHQRNEAHEALIKAWHSAITSGFSPKTYAPLDQIGELLVKVGDLRGARFVAEDYRGAYPGAGMVDKRYALYCSILESTDDPRH